MTNTQLKLMISVFSRRIAEGEKFDDIALDYPRLTKTDLKQIRAAVS